MPFLALRRHTNLYWPSCPRLVMAPRPDHIHGLCGRGRIRVWKAVLQWRVQKEGGLNWYFIINLQMLVVSAILTRFAIPQKKRIPLAVFQLTDDLGDVYARQASMCHNRHGPHGCGVPGQRGIAGVCVDSTEPFTATAMTNHVHVIAYFLSHLRHPHLARMYGR